MWGEGSQSPRAISRFVSLGMYSSLVVVKFGGSNSPWWGDCNNSDHILTPYLWECQFIQFAKSLFRPGNGVGRTGMGRMA